MTNDRAARIIDLANQVSALSAELQALLLDDTPPSSPPAPAPPAPASPSRFTIGARVQILNTRNGLQGQRGTITKTNRVFVFFKLDSDGSVIYRGRRNLLVLPSTVQ